MNLHKSSLRLVALALFTTLAAGLAGAATDGKAQMGMEQLTAQLTLSPEQQASIAPALEERNARLSSLRSEADATAPRRQKIKSLREAQSIQKDFVAKVTPVLTPEQNAKWEELREKMRAEMKERRSSRD